MDLIAKKRLEAVLASYGANPARWPEADRASLLAHLDEGGEGFAEARAIDRWLDLATAPELPAELESRLTARLATANVVKLARPPARPRGPLGWIAALPLAASLALGIYLGAEGKFDSFLPAAVTGDVAINDDSGSDPSGVDEVTDYSGDNLT